MTTSEIAAVHGRRVWDSRGRPTVEAEIVLAGGAIGRAIAPAGASTGSGEALDLRDRLARNLGDVNRPVRIDGLDDVAIFEQLNFIHAPPPL